MRKSSLFKDLQCRLICLLKDPVLADTRLNRITQKMGEIEDAIASHNFAVSEEILGLEASSVIGTVHSEILSNFRRCLTSYLNANGPADAGYRKYVFIICDYLAMVGQKPLHPTYIRHVKNNPPKDRAGRRYCALKAEYLHVPDTLCRYCSADAWPDK